MTKKESKYFEAVGRRKTSIARVRLHDEKPAKDSAITVNERKIDQYFHSEQLISSITAPLRATGNSEKFSITVRVNGGGQTGQANAVQLGIARALVKFNSELQKTLRDFDYLKRDPRKKERKKPGLKKARRAPQFSKR